VGERVLHLKERQEECAELAEGVLRLLMVVRRLQEVLSERGRSGEMKRRVDLCPSSHDSPRVGSGRRVLLCVVCRSSSSAESVRESKCMVTG
jgi:hypothetical protein